MDFIIEHLDDITLVVTGTVTVASIIVRMTPTQKDDKILSKVVKLMKKLSIPIKENK